MVTLDPYTRSASFVGFDYVFDKVKDFKSVRVYLLPKLQGSWKIAFIQPDIGFVRELLDTEQPNWIEHSLYLDKAVYALALAEYPKYATEKESAWEKYVRLIARMEVPITQHAMSELYARVGPAEDKLVAALNALQLECPDGIEFADISKRYPKRTDIYPGSVVDAFLQKSRYRWTLYRKLESSLGTVHAFYAIRKYVRLIMKEKADYLANKEVSRKIVKEVPGSQIVKLYMLFENANSPQELYPILLQME